MSTRFDNKTLISLGIISSKKEQKIMPNGKHYIKVREIVRFLNDKFRSEYKKDKFVGFFPNKPRRGCDSKTFYIVTSDFRLNYDDKRYAAYRKMFANKYPDIPIEYCSLYKREVYFRFKEAEGLYIM